MAIFGDFISLKEAAQISGYHSDYIGALVRGGKIQGKKNGKNWFVSKRAVKAHFMSKHYVPVTHLFSLKFNIIAAITVIAGVVAVWYGFFAGNSNSSNVVTNSVNSKEVNVKRTLTDTEGPQDTDAQISK